MKPDLVQLTAELLVDILGVLNVLSQALYVMLQCVDGGCRYDAGLPHHAAE